MKVKVEKPSDEEVRAMRRWPTWSKEESVFDWRYDSEETCYLLAGEVAVTTEDGDVVEFGRGDLVTFPEGLKCVWDIRKAVLKHYRLG